MNDSLIFRRAEQKDLRDIVRLLIEDELGSKREKIEDKIPSSYQAAFDEILSDPNQELMVLEKEGAVIGTCHLTLMPSLTFQGGKRLNIEAVRVDEKIRGQGVGDWMFSEVIKWARKKGCKIVQLATNKKRINAKKFYEKLGFEATHEGMKLYL